MNTIRYAQHATRGGEMQSYTYDEASYKSMWLALNHLEAWCGTPDNILYDQDDTSPVGIIGMDS